MFKGTMTKRPVQKHKGRHKNSYNIMTQQTFKKHKILFLCLRAPWQNGPYKTNTQNNTKNTKTQQIFFVFFGFFFFNILFQLQFIKWFFQELLSHRRGTVNDLHWKFKPVLSYSKPVMKIKLKKWI